MICCTVNCQQGRRCPYKAQNTYLVDLFLSCVLVAACVVVALLVTQIV